jgi:hypothetical protein
MNAAVKSFLLVVCAGLALALGGAAPGAAAAKPCWRALIDDWYDGKIDNTYKPACYTQAIHHLPRDVIDYSNAASEIQSALLVVLRKNDDNNGGPPTAKPRDVTRNVQSSDESRQSKGEGHAQGIIVRTIKWFGPADAAAVPLPLVFLAGVALLLLAAAGGTLVNRRLQARRLPRQT